MSTISKNKRGWKLHTPTMDGKPFISERYHLVALDTGVGGNWPLTLMDMDTLDTWAK